MQLLWGARNFRHFFAGRLLFREIYAEREKRAEKRVLRFDCKKCKVCPYEYNVNFLVSARAHPYGQYFFVRETDMAILLSDYTAIQCIFLLIFF